MVSGGVAKRQLEWDDAGDNVRDKSASSKKRARKAQKTRMKEAVEDARRVNPNAGKPVKQKAILNAKPAKGKGKGKGPKGSAFL